MGSIHYQSSLLFSRLPTSVFSLREKLVLRREGLDKLVMTNNQKIRIAVKYLSEVNKSWDDAMVENYTSKMSFDELVECLDNVVLKN